jgi:hypothetical protein
VEGGKQIGSVLATGRRGDIGSASDTRAWVTCLAWRFRCGGLGPARRAWHGTQRVGSSSGRRSLARVGAAVGIGSSRDVQVCRA